VLHVDDQLQAAYGAELRSVSFGEQRLESYRLSSRPEHLEPESFHRRWLVRRKLGGEDHRAW